MDAKGISQAKMADLLEVDKATVSRSISSGSFSPALRANAVALLAQSHEAEDFTILLHKSLHILTQSRILFDAAQSLIAQALDLAERGQ